MSNQEPSPSELEFLQRLMRGGDFSVVATLMGDEGVKAAFQCVLKGWIDRGKLTKEGLRVATAPRRANFEITILPSEKK